MKNYNSATLNWQLKNSANQIIYLDEIKDNIAYQK